MVSVLALWEGRPDVPVTQSLVRLLADEAVPYLAAYRYKVGCASGRHGRPPGGSSASRTRARGSARSRCRRSTRQRISGGTRIGRRGGSWTCRRSGSFCTRMQVDETDPTPLLGWAGWDHAQQSLALSLVIGDREKDGWDDNRPGPAGRRASRVAAVGGTVARRGRPPPTG